MSLFRTDRRIALFVRNISGTYNVISQQTVRSSQSDIKFGKGKKAKTFTLHIENPAYRKGSTWYYLIDIMKGQVVIGESAEKIPPEMTDVFMTRKTVQNIIAGIEKPQLSQYLIYIILSLCAGIPIGYIIGNFFPMTGG